MKVTVSEMCKNKVLSSSPLCFKYCFCLNSMPGKGGMGIVLVAVGVAVPWTCRTQAVVWRVPSGQIPLLVSVSARGLVGFGRFLCLFLREM